MITNDVLLGPTGFNYTRVLETVFTYLKQTWECNDKNKIIGNFGQVVVLLIPSAHISNDEKESATTLLRQLKYIYPGKNTNFKYEVKPMNFNDLFFFSLIS